jgi:hypothetical protein
MATQTKTTGLGKIWLQGDKKDPVHHKTTQGNGRGSRAKGSRKLSRGQGR